MDKEGRDNLIAALSQAINVGLESDRLKLQEYKRLFSLAVLVMTNETLETYQEQMIRYLASRNESDDKLSFIPLQKLRSLQPSAIAKNKRMH